MSTLDDLQARINKEKALKDAFLKDPVGTLRNEGVDVPPDAEEALRDGVAKLVAKFKASGSALEAAATPINPIIRVVGGDGPIRIKL